MSAPSTPAAASAGPRRRRIGLLGGSFDPVHQGHLHAARAALQRFALDRVVFVPAAQSPHKPGVRMATGAERLAMLEIALRGEPRFSTSPIELERGGSSYTIDTVRALPRAIGEPEECALFLILGSDNLALLPTWREARALLERVQPVVVHRDGEPDALLDALEAQWGPELAAKVRAGYVRLPPVRVSSTHVRAHAARLAGSDADVDPAVLAYIRQHGLYGTGP